MVHHFTLSHQRDLSQSLDIDRLVFDGHDRRQSDHLLDQRLLELLQVPRAPEHHGDERADRGNGDVFIVLTNGAD